MSVAIIGAGPSGLVAAKEAKACGLVPTVFEQAETIGGLWRPKTGGMWDGMQTNISIHNMSFSDFFWSNQASDFPQASEVHDYLCKYAEKFSLFPHIHLNSKVTSVQESERMWSVTSTTNGEEKTQLFHSLIICSGIYSKEFIPSIPGLDNFKGDSLHSHSYRSPEKFRDKTVVVIGNSFSGTEIASDIAPFAKKVFHVFNRSFWIMPRHYPVPVCTENGTEILPQPWDLISHSRKSSLVSYNPNCMAYYKMRYASLQKVCEKQLLMPPKLEIPPDDQPPYVAISDTYLERVKTDQIAPMKEKIERVEGSAIHFSSGSSLTADALLFCTGYRAHISFMGEEIQNRIEFDSTDPFQPFLLHKTILHPKLPNAAFVGMYRGPYFATMELQARYACGVLSFKIPSPTPLEMANGIESEREIRTLDPRPQFPHGNYVAFSDSLANDIGVLPDFNKLQLEDNALFQQLYNGIFTCKSYRLNNKPPSATVKEG